MLGPYPRNAIHGGIESVIACYLNSRLSESFEIIYLQTSTKANALKKIKYLLKSTLQLIACFLLQEISLVHIHTASGPSFYRKSWYCLLARLFRQKICLHIHGGSFHEFFEASSQVKKRWITSTLNHATRILVLTDLWIEVIGAKTCNKQISKLYNPIEAALFDNPSPAGEEHQPKKILFMGKLNREKGIFDICHAIPQVVAACPAVRFVFCGTGEIEALLACCSKLGVRAYVEFSGWISGAEKIAMYKASYIFILPSYIEGLPVSIIEAYAAGLPVISSSVGGIPDILKENVNGFIIQPGDFEALAERLLRLLTDQTLYKTIAVENRRQARKVFDLPIIVTQLISLYNEIINN